MDDADEEQLENAAYIGLYNTNPLSILTCCTAHSSTCL